MSDKNVCIEIDPHTRLWTASGFLKWVEHIWFMLKERTADVAVGNRRHVIQGPFVMSDTWWVSSRFETVDGGDETVKDTKKIKDCPTGAFRSHVILAPHWILQV